MKKEILWGKTFINAEWEKQMKLREKEGPLMIKLCSGKREEGRSRSGQLKSTAPCRYEVEGLCDHRGKPSLCPLTDEEYNALPEITEDEAWERITRSNSKASK